MSIVEILIFAGALSVPLMMMLAHDIRISRQRGEKLSELPAAFNRYCSLLVLPAIYGGIFYLLLILYTNGYLDNSQTISLYDWDDYFVPTACISTLSILLFGYILQADNAFYLKSLLSKDHAPTGGRDLILRTFRSISVGQIAPGILYPLSVSLWALHGAWLYNIYNIVMRASNQDLMPKVFFSGGVRMLLALFVSILVYSLFQSMTRTRAYKESEEGGERVLVVKSRKFAYLLVIVAFFSGVVPMQAAESVWQSVRSTVAGAAPATLSMEHLQGMNAFMRDRLFEEGIIDIHQLATIGLRRDLLHSRIENLISEQQLDDWIDQSQLMLFVNERKLLNTLRSMGIRGKMQLDRLVRTENSANFQELFQNEKGTNEMAAYAFIRRYSLTSAVDADVLRDSVESFPTQ